MLTTDYKFGEAFPLAAQIEKSDEKVEFKEIMSNDNGGISILAFGAGQELATHVAPAEVMIYIPEGEVIFTMNGNSTRLHKGDFFLMGNGVPHSVHAVKDSKIMLIKIKHD